MIPVRAVRAYSYGCFGTKHEGDTRKDDTLSTYHSVSNSLHVRHSIHTAIVTDNEVDLRIELCFEMLMAHEVLEAG